MIKTAHLFTKESLSSCQVYFVKMKGWRGKPETPGYLQDTILRSTDVTHRKHTRIYNIQSLSQPICARKRTLKYPSIAIYVICETYHKYHRMRL